MKAPEGNPGMLLKNFNRNCKPELKLVCTNSEGFCAPTIRDIHVIQHGQIEQIKIQDSQLNLNFSETAKFFNVSISHAILVFSMTMFSAML